MRQPKSMTDQAVNRLQELTARLTEYLQDAEGIRTRFTKARDANVWPDPRSHSRLLHPTATAHARTD